MTSKVDMISVVIPTLNEAGTILEAINTIDKHVTYPKEIIIVDGARRMELLRSLKTQTAVDSLSNRDGYGLALRTGMKAARAMS